MTARFLVGDVLEQIATLPDASVDLVLSSPPFLALRSYLPDDHPNKAKEVGSESTPGAFIDTILDVVEACARVLTPRGSLVFEFGDTYASAGGTTDNRATSEGGNDLVARPPRRARGRSRDTRPGRDQTATAHTPRPESPGGDGWPLDKSLALIPESFAWALAYGRNPFTGRTTDPWRIRNFCPWVRPNPPVGALGDKFRPGTSYLTVACKQRDRWFDLDAVRVPADPANKRTSTLKRENIPGRTDQVMNPLGPDGQRIISNENGAPPLDWFNVPTQPYAGSHYATWPKKLVLPFILSMCPPGGTVLDPFAGSGTTLAVATGCGRNAIGIDLDARNLDLARERIGMFLVEEPIA